MGCSKFGLGTGGSRLRSAQHRAGKEREGEKSNESVKTQVVAVRINSFFSCSFCCCALLSRQVITAKQTTVKMPDGAIVSVKVWNATVANLSLMALGSSAPEILLSVIEIISASFFSGELGPSTIVGSAAFNLFMIIAVCVLALPDGEVKKVEDMGVYIVTAAFSLFAYFWLLIILMGTSPNVVEAWEGIMTFAFFPVLIFLAYGADQHW